MSPPVERRLAAILAADVVGYSKLVERDEAGTLSAIKSMRQDTVDPLLAEHRGRIVKLMGDGLIAEFGSVVSAVACAAAIQIRLTKAQEAIASEHRIVLRIGVHLGDLVVEGEDLMGDGVNVAARLEQLCPPGGVLISSATYEQLPGKLDLAFEDAGEQRLKNITRSVRAYRWNPAGAPSSPSLAPRTNEKPAVAVLPFENMSGDPEQVYFSDGITDDVITELSRFRELMVIARNSSFAFRGKSMDVREIGAALGAAYIVEGNVRRAGARVRITAQLVDAAGGAHLWAERYDRAIEDVFAVQEEIARGIAVVVAQRVFDAGEIAAQRRPPQDVRAYDLFLKAVRLGGVSFRPEVQAQIEALYEQALAIDPTLARAYSGLAFIHWDRDSDVIAGVQPQPAKHQLSALRLAERALALDPNDPRVQSTYGWVCANLREFDRAERHLDLARAMNPNDAVVHAFWARIQGMRGRPERGLEAAEIACRLNPRYPPWFSSFLGQMHFQLGQYEEAARLLDRRVWDVPPRHLRDLGWRVSAYGHLGRLEEAARLGEELLHEIRSHWRGSPDAKPSDYIDWIVWYSRLEHEADMERVRVGMRLAGLPA